MRTWMIRSTCWGAAILGACVLLDPSGVAGHAASKRRPPHCVDGVCLSSPHHYGHYQTSWRRWPGEAEAERNGKANRPREEVSPGPYSPPSAKDEDRAPGKRRGDDKRNPFGDDPEQKTPPDTTPDGDTPKTPTEGKTTPPADDAPKPANAAPDAAAPGISPIPALGPARPGFPSPGELDLQGANRPESDRDDVLEDRAPTPPGVVQRKRRTPWLDDDEAPSPQADNSPDGLLEFPTVDGPRVDVAPQSNPIRRVSGFLDDPPPAMTESSEVKENHHERRLITPEPRQRRSADVGNPLRSASSTGSDTMVWRNPLRETSRPQIRKPTPRTPERSGHYGTPSTATPAVAAPVIDLEELNRAR